MTDEPREIPTGPERKFDQRLDLSPLEHLLIGSGTKLSDGRILSRELIRNEANIAKDKGALLKPTGLRLGSSTIEEIKKGRRQKGTISFIPSFLKLNDEFILNYNFKLFLPQIDVEGHIRPEFAMQMQKSTPEGPKSLVALEGEDRRVFDQLDLDPSVKSLFSLEKAPSAGMLTLRYLPLQMQRTK